MRSWATAVRAMRCGYDVTHVIRAGEEYLVIEILGTTHTRVRCQACAAKYEPAPIEPPALEESAS